MFKTLLYHLSSDSVPSLDQEEGRQVWRLAAPLLTTVLSYAHVSDHNLPAPLSSRIQDLVHSTVDEVLLKLLDFKFDRVDEKLYANLATSLVELVELVATFRGIEFDDVTRFRDQLLDKIVKRKKIGDYRNLVVQGLRSRCTQETKIWKLFHKELISDPETFQLISSSIPPEYIGAVDVKERDQLLDCENPVYSALVIFSAFSKMKKAKFLAQVSRLELWIEPENWSSLQSELSNVLQNCFLQIDELYGGTSSSVSLAGLEKLPIESIPRVQRLGLTLLCIYLLPSSGSTVSKDLSNLLCRCFEDTDVFRFLNSSTFLQRVLPLQFPSPSFLQVLAGELVKYTKMITELTDTFETFQGGVLSGNLNHTEFFVTLLERLVRFVLDSNLAQEKKTAAENLAALVSKVGLAFIILNVIS